MPIDFIDYSKRYNNSLTLLGYCFYNKFQIILDFAYAKKLKRIYKNKNYWKYSQEGDFAGMYTCIRNGINLE